MGSARVLFTQKDSTIESTIGRLAQCHPQPSVSAQCTPRSDAFGILTSASSSSSSCIGPHRPSARCQWGAPHASCSLMLQTGINLAHRSAGINHTRRQWGYTARAPCSSSSRRGLPRTPVSGDETTHAASGDYHSRLSLLDEGGDYLTHRSAGINHSRRQWGLPRTPQPLDAGGDYLTHRSAGTKPSRRQWGLPLSPQSSLVQAGITSHTGQRG